VKDLLILNVILVTALDSYLPPQSDIVKSLAQSDNSVTKSKENVEIVMMDVLLVNTSVMETSLNVTLNVTNVNIQNILMLK
jgi:hypothetical protein